MAQDRKSRGVRPPLECDCAKKSSGQALLAVSCTPKMFTGLIQHMGSIESRTSTDAGDRLSIDPQGWQYQPSIGASIAVDGCCLSLVEARGSRWFFDVIPQTLRVTTLGSLAVGDPVNLEHAAVADTLLGGHLVQGHIDCTGVLESAGQRGDEYRCRIEFDSEYAPLLVSRGSVAISGVSLTVADLGPGWFEVALIPTTLRDTTLGCLRSGDSVNLEFDVFAKMIERQLALRAATPPTI
ncbi:MAG: riboflavin synthase [Planctomycetes bacterium]|nr:riboflavin synthase [Planctomycetota bacterium]